MMQPTPQMLALPDPHSNYRWFSSYGYVVERGDQREVFVGGTLIGRFGPKERGMRNAILMGLCSDPRALYTQLAQAFGLTEEGLRLMRRQYEREGLMAVVARTVGGSEPKVTPQLRAKLEKCFEQGMSVSKAHAAIHRKVSRASVGLVRYACFERRAAAATANETIAANVPAGRAPTTEVAATLTLPFQADVEGSVANDADDEPVFELVTVKTPKVDTTGAADETTGEQVLAMDASAEDVDADLSVAKDTASTPDGEDDRGIRAVPIASSPLVQHAGAWVMLAMLESMGLYDLAQTLCPPRIKPVALRVALDAFATAIAIGQRCAEGVRRLATPSGPQLLRANHTPSASWVRSTLGSFAAKQNGTRFHFAMARSYVEAAAEDEAKREPVVFYVDNHLRPYTGKATIRKGWRMQDKRALPGITDYYVHDEDGRPVFRVSVASNTPLTNWLLPLARQTREWLGKDQLLVFAFDRAGAYADQLAELRDDGIHFVTYERRPFRLLSPGQFDKSFTYEGETIKVHDARINLGKGRGRLRRIALRMDDDRQVNLLAVSKDADEQLSAKTLHAIMRGRWRQENGFKHGVERWGQNQLDGRTTKPYDPEAVIPNPARRRLDRALRLAREREATALRKLQHLASDDPRRAKWDAEVAEATKEQESLEAFRPTTPTHAPLQETDLAGKLVRHTDEYKNALDTVRIACANVESELACILARHLRRPAEAKRLLANLFTAPGSVRVGKQSISVTLHMAGTSSELRAVDELFRVVTSWHLMLPGSARRLRLRVTPKSG